MNNSENTTSYTSQVKEVVATPVGEKFRYHVELHDGQTEVIRKKGKGYLWACLHEGAQAYQFKGEKSEHGLSEPGLWWTFHSRRDLCKRDSRFHPEGYTVKAFEVIFEDDTEEPTTEPTPFTPEPTTLTGIPAIVMESSYPELSPEERYQLVAGELETAQKYIQAFGPCSTVYETQTAEETAAFYLESKSESWGAKDWTEFAQTGYDIEETALLRATGCSLSSEDKLALLHRLQAAGFAVTGDDTEPTAEPTPEPTPFTPSTVINTPEPILTALQEGASLAISISGGKDSLAMLKALSRFWKAHSFTGEIFAIHADLGRAEWHQTPEVVEQHARAFGLPLTVVQRTKGDLFQRYQERFEQRPDAPPFASSSCRFCTSDLKRDPINKALRAYDHIVCAVGLRAQESTARSKKPEWEIRKRIQTQSRDAYTWHPILHWSEQDVWAEIFDDPHGQATIDMLRARYTQSGQLESWQADTSMVHPAYILGNERLSCNLCVLASRSDIKNGATHNREAFNWLMDLEVKSGFTFTTEISLVELLEELPEEETKEEAPMDITEALTTTPEPMFAPAELTLETVLASITQLRKQISKAANDIIDFGATLNDEQEEMSTALLATCGVLLKFHTKLGTEGGHLIEAELTDSRNALNAATASEPTPEPSAPEQPTLKPQVAPVGLKAVREILVAPKGSGKYSFTVHYVDGTTEVIKKKGNPAAYVVRHHATGSAKWRDRRGKLIAKETIWKKPQISWSFHSRFDLCRSRSHEISTIEIFKVV